MPELLLSVLTETWGFLSLRYAISSLAKMITTKLRRRSRSTAFLRRLGAIPTVAALFAKSVGGSVIVRTARVAKGLNRMEVYTASTLTRRRRI